MFQRVIGLCALVLLTVSCGTGAKVINSATYAKGAARLYITPVQVDLKVSPKKISYFMPVSDAIGRGGLDNVISTAVKEALDANGGDVIVGLETSVTYYSDGSIESINITGYPATYINFRSNESLPPVQPEAGQKGGLLGGLKLKK